ncbi:hypothetical protein TSUD_93900 [Trifolium subterraneum]|uniref:C-JID domain-containing protein n=1 Tax=Trifolium subterraneum TaxID=3900 RepID=A0A2Z6NWS8_TRISU|nr:hypothetical protein TSUD_93900 [Trifolium subterraneum]
MFLESLPQLPFPTAINWDFGIYKFIGLHIFNCPKLGERECRIAFSWMKQFIQANPQCPHAIDIVIPGSEIPSWFNNQSEGDTILMDNSPIMHDINNDIIGFLFCSVFSVPPSTRPIYFCYPYPEKIKLRIILHLYFDGTVDKLHWPDHQNDILVIYKKRDLIKVKRNHIWLTYFPRNLSLYVPDFHGIMDVKFDSRYYDSDSGNNEVKNCGYGLLHKQDLQEFNLTTMHPGNSSALKHKFLAIEDEAQQEHSLI